MKRYIRTFVVAAVPGALFGYVLYELIQAFSTVIIACSVAGFILAIPTGMLYYLRAEAGGGISSREKR